MFDPTFDLDAALAKAEQEAAADLERLQEEKELAELAELDALLRQRPEALPVAEDGTLLV